MLKYFAKLVANELYLLEIKNKLRLLVIEIDNKLDDRVLSLIEDYDNIGQILKVVDQRGRTISGTIGSGNRGQLIVEDYEDLIYSLKNKSWY